MPFFEKLSPSLQAGLIIIIDPFLKSMGVSLERDKVFQKLGVAHATAYESARRLATIIGSDHGGYKEKRAKDQKSKRLDSRNSFWADVVRHINTNPNCWLDGERNTLTAEFKSFLLRKKDEYQLEWTELDQMLAIPAESLKKIMGDAYLEQSMRDKVIEILGPYLRDRSGYVSVKGLCEKNPEILGNLNLTYLQLRRFLFKMDFVTRIGIFRANTEIDRAECELRRKRILEILHDRPASFAINRASWSLPSLSIAYQSRFGFPIHRLIVGQLLKQSGYTIKKARRTLTSPDPDYREKVELLLQTLRNLQNDEFLFFIDEMGPIRIKKYGGRLFVHKNTKPSIPQLQADKGSITMSAALNATKNQVTWLYSRAKDTTAMIDLIEILFNQHPTAKTIYLTWDAAAWHRSMGLVQWLDDFNSETHRLGSGPTIHLVPLPTSSQFLDVLEAVFSGMKKAVIHHSDYLCKTEMKTAISQHFAERNVHFEKNPKRAGKKIWELDFFDNIENLKSGDYREW